MGVLGFVVVVLLAWTALATICGLALGYAIARLEGDDDLDGPPGPGR